MGGNIGEIQLGSKRELYKYINHYAVVIKASSKIILVQVYIIFALCLCFLPVHSGHQVRWTYQPGSHRRNVTPNF